MTGDGHGSGHSSRESGTLGYPPGEGFAQAPYADHAHPHFAEQSGLTGSTNSAATVDGPDHSQSPRVVDSARQSSDPADMQGANRYGSSASYASSGYASNISDPPCATNLHGSSAEDQYQDRMKRWEERKQEKLLIAQKNKKAGLRGKNFLPAAALRENTMSDAESAAVQGVLSGKGLPIELLQVLGSGNFAKVYKGVWTAPDSTTSFVAVKLINVQSGSVSSDGVISAPKALKRETQTSREHVHAHLIQTLDVAIDTLPYVIVLEFCAGGALENIVSGDVNISLLRFSWSQRLKASLDIALGMKHLHAHRPIIVHRDLKTANVLLAHPVLTVDDKVHAKVADFGLARFLPTDHETKLTRQVGSWYFMAPEVFDVGGLLVKYDEKIDVYSYAIMLYEMLAGKLVFGEKGNMSSSEFLVFAAGGGRPNENAIPETAPEVLRTLMTDGWDADPSKRPDFPEIVDRCRRISHPGENEEEKDPGQKHSEHVEKKDEAYEALPGLEVLAKRQLQNTELEGLTTSIANIRLTA